MCSIVSFVSSSLPHSLTEPSQIAVVLRPLPTLNVQPCRSLFIFWQFFNAPLLLYHIQWRYGCLITRCTKCVTYMTACCVTEYSTSTYITKMWRLNGSGAKKILKSLFFAFWFSWRKMELHQHWTIQKWNLISLKYWNSRKPFKAKICFLSALSTVKIWQTRFYSAVTSMQKPRPTQEFVDRELLLFHFLVSWSVDSLKEMPLKKCNIPWYPPLCFFYTNLLHPRVQIFYQKLVNNHFLSLTYSNCTFGRSWTNSKCCVVIQSFALHLSFFFFAKTKLRFIVIHSPLRMSNKSVTPCFVRQHYQF